jgi:hypothetical protein
LIRKVLISATPQPAQYTACISAIPTGLATDQITAGIGRHCQYSSSSTRLASST